MLAEATSGVLKVKFPKESRLSLGCGCRNGMWEVLTEFDYTEKNIVTIGRLVTPTTRRRRPRSGR